MFWNTEFERSWLSCSLPSCSLCGEFQFILAVLLAILSVIAVIVSTMSIVCTSRWYTCTLSWRWRSMSVLGLLSELALAMALSEFGAQADSYSICSLSAGEVLYSLPRWPALGMLEFGRPRLSSRAMTGRARLRWTSCRAIYSLSLMAPIPRRDQRRVLPAAAMLPPTQTMLVFLITSGS